MGAILFKNNMDDSSIGIQQCGPSHNTFFQMTKDYFVISVVLTYIDEPFEDNCDAPDHRDFFGTSKENGGSDQAAL